MEISDFRIEIDPELSEETKEIARKELRECEEIAKEAEEELRKLIEQDEGFTFPEDPYFLKIFLRPCKYYPESAFNLVSLQHWWGLKGDTETNGKKMVFLCLDQAGVDFPGQIQGDSAGADAEGREGCFCELQSHHYL